MKPTRLMFTIGVAAGLYGAPCLPTSAQSAGATVQASTPIAASAPTTVPPLIPYNGVARDVDGKPLTGNSSITFLLFKEEAGGEPLFTETQGVTIDSAGNYKVQLGATLANGLPSELFSTGEARWLEVQMVGERPQPRVLLVSVPYALKAADAATLGGLPASAFVLARSTSAGGPGPLRATSLSAVAPAATTAATTATPVTTVGGTAGSLAMFSDVATVANSKVFQNATGVGIATSTPAAILDVNGSSLFRGTVSLRPAGAATATAGVNSFPLTLAAQGYNSTSKAAVTPTFQWESLITGNNTAAPSATLNLLSSNGTAAATATRFYFNPNGTIHFAAGQTFPSSGTITGVTAGTDLLGGGTTGNVTLNLDTTKVVTGVTAGTGLTGGGAGGKLTLNLDTTKIPQLSAAANSFTGSLNVGGAITTPGAITAGGVTTNGTLVKAMGVSDAFSGYGSYPIDLQASTYDYFLGSLTKNFRIQAESVGNGSGFSSASLNLLYGSGGAAPAETGVSFGANGAFSASSVSTNSMSTNSLSTSSVLVAQQPGVFSTPNLVVQADDDGAARHAAQQLVIQGASHNDQQLLIGYVTNVNTNSNGGMATIQATWKNVVNTGLFLQPNGGCVCIRTSNIGYANQPLVVGQGQGLALADGWATYSSRRWKSNIQTLPNALSTVEKLRGVSYTLKATGKHEIGVIAEEVGAVVPEVVTWEANGKDAQSVDYTRLTALLIEATKQQQSEIAALNTKLRSALEQISSQRTLIRKQTATVNVLEKEIHSSSLVSAAAISHAVSTAQEHRTAHAVATALASGPTQR